MYFEKIKPDSVNYDMGELMEIRAMNTGRIHFAMTVENPEGGECLVLLDDAVVETIVASGNIKIHTTEDSYVVQSVYADFIAKVG